MTGGRRHKEAGKRSRVGLEQRRRSAKVGLERQTMKKLAIAGLSALALTFAACGSSTASSHTSTTAAAVGSAAKKVPKSTTTSAPTTTVPPTTTTVPPTTTTTPPPPPPTTQPYTPPPAAAAPAPASCTPTSAAGNCYHAGEYCSNADHGLTGTDGNGGPIICTDNNGWRWEPN
jgi:hypothetical protein